MFFDPICIRILKLYVCVYVSQTFKIERKILIFQYAMEISYAYLSDYSIEQLNTHHEMIHWCEQVKYKIIIASLALFLYSHRFLMCKIFKCQSRNAVLSINLHSIAKPSRLCRLFVSCSSSQRYLLVHSQIFSIVDKRTLANNFARSKIVTTAQRVITSISFLIF